MSHDIIQDADGSARFVDDRTGNRSAHLAPNARIKTTAMFKITQTSPGVLTGTGGDTNAGLPGGAVPIGLRFFSPLPASTGATITVGIDTTSTYFLNGLSVATLALNGQQVPAGVANLAKALALLPPGSQHVLTGYYSETATALGGGPWFGEIDYYVPVPA